MATYRKLDSNNKSDYLSQESSTPEFKGQKYQQDTPTFESLHSGNAGRGVQGVQGFSAGKVPNSNGTESDGRPSMSKKWTE